MAHEYIYKDGAETTVAAPVAVATEIEIGQFLKLVSGEVVPVVGAADDADFYGVAKISKSATDTQALSADYQKKITVSQPNYDAVWEPRLNAATNIVCGDVLGLNDDHTLIRLGAAGTADGVAEAVETK